MPSIVRKQKGFRNHFGTLLSLGKIAYDDLVLIAPNTKENKTDTKQLVFHRDDLEDDLGKCELDFALDVGLLSQVSAAGYFDEQNVSISFFHKTVEEFLAALYIAFANEVSFQSYFSSNLTLERLLELDNILKFVIGL